MGALIPKTDHKLGKVICSTGHKRSLIFAGAIEAEDQLSINTASDFMAQYTTRQEYRFTEASQDASTIDHDLTLRKHVSCVQQTLVLTSNR